MRSFKSEFLGRHHPDHELTQTLRRLGEFKGKQDLWRAVAPDLLASLRADAAPACDQPFTTDLAVQLHGRGWKSVDNQIAGLSVKPISASAVPDAMRLLHTRFERAHQERTIDPLLLIATYHLDFFLIHPFADGNAGTAYRLSETLLRMEGYEIGLYLSLEFMAEKQAEECLAALSESSKGWETGEHSLLPWWRCFTSLLVVAYEQLEQAVVLEPRGRGSKQRAVREAIARAPARFCHGDIAKLCQAVSRPTIELVLAELRAAGAIRRVGAGRGALWEKT